MKIQLTVAIALLSFQMSYGMNAGHTESNEEISLYGSKITGFLHEEANGNFNVYYEALLENGDSIAAYYYPDDSYYCKRSIYKNRVWAVEPIGLPHKTVFHHVRRSYEQWEERNRKQ